MPFRRRRWDEQPDTKCDVLLASDGRYEFSEGAVARAAALSASGTIAVVTIAKVYGTRYGLPNPWLLPTKQELEERRGWVSKTITELERQGCTVDGQVAMTRKPTRKLTEVARVRHASVIVIDETPDTGWRRFVEGDVGSELRKKLGKDGIEVEIIPAGWGGPQDQG
jgi:hypothetical protein